MKLQNSLFTIVQRRQLDGVHSFDIRLNAEHVIYKAHFPGEPVTPGVCILQMAVEMVEKVVSLPLSLVGVKNVKFLRIISPVEVPEVCYSVQKVVVEDETVTAQVVVSSADGIYAKLSLTCKKTA